MPARTLPARIKKALSGHPPVRLLRGVFASGDAAGALADVHGGRIPVFLAGYQPQPGEDVWVLACSDIHLILGPVDSTAPPPDPPPDPPPVDGGTGGTTGPQTHSATFYATDAGTWIPALNGWVDTVNWYGDGQIGCWFYGPQIADSIGDDATVTAAQIYLPPDSNPADIGGAGGNTGAAVPYLGTHLLTARPSGEPQTSDVVRAGGWQGWVDITLTGILDVLKARVGGVTMYAPVDVAVTAWIVYESILSDPMTGALRVTWTE